MIVIILPGCFTRSYVSQEFLFNTIISKMRGWMAVSQSEVAKPCCGWQECSVRCGLVGRGV